MLTLAFRLAATISVAFPLTGAQPSTYAPSPSPTQAQERLSRCRGPQSEVLGNGMTIAQCVVAIRQVSPGCSPEYEYGLWGEDGAQWLIRLSPNGEAHEDRVPHDARWDRINVPLDPTCRGARVLPVRPPLASRPTTPASDRLARARQCLTFSYHWEPELYSGENWAGGRTLIRPARQRAGLRRNPACSVRSYRVTVGVGSGASCRALQYHPGSFLLEDTARFPAASSVDGRATCILSVSQWEE